MYKILKKWVLYVLCLTMSAGTIYVVAQQMLRLGGNSPQIQISEDVANNLNAGINIDSYIAHGIVDISRSLDTFLVVYNNDNTNTYSSGNLNGQPIVVPEGVLNYAKENGQNRVTWQPEKGVRIAIVVTKYNNGTVLVGRSLREVEKNIDMVGKLVGLSYILGLATTLGWLLIIKKKKQD